MIHIDEIYIYPEQMTVPKSAKKSFDPQKKLFHYFYSYYYFFASLTNSAEKFLFLNDRILIRSCSSKKNKNKEAENLTLLTEAF